MNDAELAVLESKGFVISSRRQFPSFLRGYAAIYMEDLPVYVSADAILDALHRSYDDILFSIESDVLQSLLEQWLSRIDAVQAPERAKADLRLYLEVALELLRPNSGDRAISAEARALAEQAKAAAGIAEVPLFGLSRLMDFSQFTPRGHYTQDLQNYFRAMMWLGRVDFRLLETQPDGSVVFRRAQYEAALALHQLVNEPTRQLWSDIDDTLRAFVGESDYMTLPELGQLVAALGGLEAALGAGDMEVAMAIRDGGYGEQQIASHLMVNDGTVATLPLNRSLAVFGQRYVADSHVLSQVVYDRIARRMMPNPLDVAFAALGNNQALQLSPDLQLFDGLPGALGSARRLLNTQLGSWAQLRHDTLLYAKQSYSGIPSCEFPDAHIEPEFFAAIVRYAERGAQLAGVGGYMGQQLTNYFSRLRTIAARLQQVAEHQRTGTPHSAEQLAFINDAVRVDVSQGCVVVEAADGWYADLFCFRDASLKQDPTIADVHTQPADADGTIVGHVLHVATGLPRQMTVTIDTCAGPRAYVGLAYAYHEQITEDFQRLTDEEWNSRLTDGAAPEEVPWLSDVIAP